MADFDNRQIILIGSNSKNPISCYRLLTYALVGLLSIVLLSIFNNNNNTNDNENKDSEEQYDTDPLTSLTFEKIYSRGLYSTLERYRDQCVPELRGQIEQTIDSVRSMERGDDDAQLFTFANRRRLDTRQSGAMDYIGVVIRKVNSNNNKKQQGQGQLFDYTIYTYAKPVEPVKKHQRNGIISIFNLIKRLIFGVEEEDSMYSKDRIEALHTSFMAELVKRGVIAKMDDHKPLMLI